MYSCARQFKANGCSILLVSHGLAIVKQLCDEVIWMNAGRLMAQGPVRDVVRQYEAHVGYTMEPDVVPEPAAAMPVTAQAAAPADAARVGEDEAVGSGDTRGPEPVRIVALGLSDGSARSLLTHAVINCTSDINKNKWRNNSSGVFESLNRELFSYGAVHI